MRSVLLLVVALCTSSSASAQLAVFVTNPDQSVAHRDFAAGVVSALQERAAFLDPPMSTDDVALCRAELGCVVEKAKGLGASHVLALGVTSLGGREIAVTVKIVSVVGAVVVDERAAISGSADVRSDGRAFAATLKLDALAVAAPSPRPVRAPPRPPRAPLGAIGAGLVGAGAAVAVMSVAVAGALVAPDARATVGGISLGGGLTGAVVAVAGAGLVVADALIEFAPPSGCE